MGWLLVFVHWKIFVEREMKKTKTSLQIFPIGRLQHYSRAYFWTSFSADCFWRAKNCYELKSITEILRIWQESKKSDKTPTPPLGLSCQRRLWMVPNSVRPRGKSQRRSRRQHSKSWTGVVPHFPAKKVRYPKYFAIKVFHFHLRSFICFLFSAVRRYLQSANY